MKQAILLFLCCLFTILDGQAQDLTYAGPAKTQVKMFWAQIEKLKSGTATASAITNGERAIKTIKEMDKNYSTSAMEEALKPWKEKAEKEKNEKKDLMAKGDEDKLYFSGLWQKMIGVYSKGNDIEPGITGKAYYERVKELDLASYTEKKKAAGAVSPKSYIALIDEMLADYDEYIVRADRLKWNVVQPMTSSRNASNPQEKMGLLEHAKFECEAVLLLSPNNEPFKKKLEEINKLMGSAAGEASKFFTSDFHKANLNKIVWSTKPLVVSKENEMSSSIKNEFKTGDYIYGTAYLGINASDAMNNSTNLRVRIKVDGGTAIWGGDLSYFELPLAAQGKSYIQFALLPDAQWIKDNYAPYIGEENWTLSYFLDELVRAGDVSHTITCELIFPTTKIDDIESKFSLDLGEGSTAIKAMATKMHGELMGSRQLPKAGMSNPGIEAKMVEGMNKLGWTDKFSKAIITSANWTIEKNQLTGTILYRYVGVVGITKAPDGKCFYQEFTFRQDYSGGGSYESAVKYNSYGGKREIGCDKIK